MKQANVIKELRDLNQRMTSEGVRLLQEIYLMEESGQETSGIVQQALMVRNSVLEEMGQAMSIAETVNARARAELDESRASGAGIIQRIEGEAHGAIAAVRGDYLRACSVVDDLRKEREATRERKIRDPL